MPRDRGKRTKRNKAGTGVLNATSTPKPKARRGRPKRSLSATSKPIGPATRDQFLAAYPGHQVKEIPTYMRQYLIHLVDTEGLPLQRVFRGLSDKSYYRWKALYLAKDSPSPLKKKKIGPSRLHDER